MVNLIEQFVLGSAVSLNFVKYTLDNTYVDNSVHYHSDIELSYVKSGRCIYNIEGLDYVVQAGDIVILRSFQHHYIKQIVQGESLVNLVLMANSQFVRYANTVALENKILPLLSRKSGQTCAIYHDSDVAQLFCEVEKLIDHKENLYKVIAKCEIFAILAHTLRLLSVDDGTVAEDLETEITQKISVITSYIDAHILEKLKLDELADMVDLNPTYLSVYFKKHTGIGITEYILQNRISLSIQKLQTTKMGIKDIALMCGFNNTANFNKAFRNIIGKTPSEIRSLAVTKSNSIS